MSIKKIKLENFKSFRKLDIELGKFNVLIGANASGKSNFVQFFRFLRDLFNSDLDNAISMQGGVEYFRNINIGVSNNFFFEIVDDTKIGFLEKPRKESFKGFEICETKYEFEMKFKGKQKRGTGFEIIREKITHKCEIFTFIRKSVKKIEKKEKIRDGEITLIRNDGKITSDLSILENENIGINANDIYPRFIKDVKLPTNDTLLKIAFLFPPWTKIIRNISIYDFDPKLPKKATPLTGKIELEEDGSNLSITIKNIIQNRDKRRKLFNLVKDLLPFIGDLDVEKFADKSLLFKLQETYFKNQYLPASLISDGTINLTALVIALYFEEKPLTIIEEPERNIHPYLIAKVVEMMKDASQRKQIIITTHNPEIVKYAGIENLLFISRDKEGFSTITRPLDKKAVKTFLENEIGIEELYIQNLLEA